MSVVRVYSRINNFLGLDFGEFGLGHKMILIPNNYGIISIEQEEPKKLRLISKFRNIKK